jgi:N-acetyltransferase
MNQRLILQGAHVRLEPLEMGHIGGLVKAASPDPSLYRWSPVPQGDTEVTKYIETALVWKAAGTALAFAVIRVADAAVIGSTRLWNVERWAWPPNHPRHGREFPDACEIGYTWLTGSALRTAANTEAKLLLLTYAFETWRVFRVCFHTDTRNQRSRAALERIGARFEGILRSHRMAVDYISRDSARYSILSSEWPGVRCGLESKLALWNRQHEQRIDPQ